MPLARLPEFPTHLVTARLWNGDALPALLRARLQREWDTVCQCTFRIRALKKERRALLKVTDDPAIAQVQQLHHSSALGSTARGYT